MSVLNNQLDLLSDVLQDFCTKHHLEEASADDILHSGVDTWGIPLTDYQRDWLTNYINVWDVIVNI